MVPSTRNISFNIFAKDDDEAQRGCNAIKQFIRMMGESGAMVSGDKIAEAVGRLSGNSFVRNEIIKFFKV